MAVSTERAKVLLGQGIPASQVAAAIGCTPAYITQLMAQDDFAKEVADLKFQSLQANNLRDAQYDKLEDKLLAQLERSAPMLVKPMEIVKALSMVNSMKRRGSNAPVDTNGAGAPQVTLILSNHSIKNFTINAHNQIISTGSQDLITATLGSVDSLSKALEAVDVGATE